MLTTFQLITLDYWENVYNMVSITINLINYNKPFIYHVHVDFVNGS